jgi:hypothetical protein
MRQIKGIRFDHKVVARTHRVVADELNTAAGSRISGEQIRRPGCTREGEKGGNW